MPKDIKLLVKKSMATARKINAILDSRGITQREFASLLGKKESEISKWLQGTHNFTYMTICKIESVLGEEIITTSTKEDPIIIYLPHLDSLRPADISCHFIPDSKSRFSEFEDNKLSFTSSDIGISSLLNLSPEISNCSIN